jgi:hypothetical protein
MSLAVGRMKADHVMYAGAHYDVGRQRFIFGREKGVLESAMRWLQQYLPFVRINITYDKTIADATFAWLVHSVQATSEGSRMLPDPPATYIQKWAEDALPWTWHLPPFAPLGKDAYEAIFTYSSLITWLPFVGPFVKVVLGEQVRTQWLSSVEFFRQSS